MYIHVSKSTGRPFRLRLPSGLVLSGFSATFIAGKIKKDHPNITGKQLRILFRAIRKYKRTHPEWTLVEIQDQQGTQIEIAL